MDELKLFIKLPARLFVFLMISWFFEFALGLWQIYDLFQNSEAKTLIDIVFTCIYMLMFSSLGAGLLVIQFGNTCYCVINRDGIFSNQLNITKKCLKWDSDLYYMVTDKYTKLYDYRKMLPLHGKMTAEHDIEYRYISLKSAKALKRQTDNKDWICISIKWIRGDVKAAEIINMINKSRGME